MVYINMLFSVTFTDLSEVINRPHEFLNTACNHSSDFRKALNLDLNFFSEEEYTTNLILPWLATLQNMPISFNCNCLDPTFTTICPSLNKHQRIHMVMHKDLGVCYLFTIIASVLRGEHTTHPCSMNQLCDTGASCQPASDDGDSCSPLTSLIIHPPWSFLHQCFLELTTSSSNHKCIYSPCSLYSQRKEMSEDN